VGDVELHLFQGLGEKDIEPAPTINEYLVESGARDYRFQDKWKTPWLREAYPLIRVGEGDGYLRPPERGRDRLFNVQNFPSGGLLRPFGG
jgi:hypothetical protein